MSAVCMRFKLPQDEPAEVKAADYAITTDEKAALMQDGPEWSNLAPPIGAKIVGLMPPAAKQSFMDRFHELIADRAAA